MGATVFLQACVWSLPLNNGESGYIWSEETYDKKDGRTHARWCTMVIGDKQHVVKRIFDLAGSLPGGMLQTPSQISVSGFIKKYLDILETPMEFESCPVTLRNSPKGFSDAITDKNRQHVCRIFEQFGKDDWAQRASSSVQEGGQNIIANWDADFEVLAALTHERYTPGTQSYCEPVVFPWQLLQMRPYHGSHIAMPKQSIPVATVAAPEMEIFRHRFMSKNEITVVVVDGKSFMGSSWEIESELVALAYENEATTPGYYRSLLAAFKKCPVRRFEKMSGFQFDTTHLSDTDFSVERILKITEILFGEAKRSTILTIEQIEELGNRSVNDQYWAIQLIGNASVCRFIPPFADIHQEALF